MLCAVLRPSRISPRPVALRWRPFSGSPFTVWQLSRPGLAAIRAVALVRGLGADPDRCCDLPPARSQPDGFAGQLVTRLDGALDFKLCLPRAVKHRPLLV